MRQTLRNHSYAYGVVRLRGQRSDLVKIMFVQTLTLKDEWI